MLSKSKFIIGQQCQKYLWLKDKGIQITNIPDESAKERLRAGNEVGEEAKNLFPGGINIEYHKKDFNKMCEITKEAIRSGNSTIYEASFFEEGVFIRVDIMQKTPNGWNIYEVKSSSRLRSYHKEDATLQWAVLSKVKNLKLNEVFVITLNNEYSKEGKIIPEELFTFHPLTKFVSENLNKTNSQLHDIKNSLLNDKEPDISIGKHCKKPHQCEYFNRCWPESITENNSIMNLYRLNFDKKVEFIKKGKDVFERIPSEGLSDTQQMQLHAYRNNKIIIRKPKIKEFIDKVEYPISYFDFETFTDSIPLYDGQRPHMQMPFQYSLHVQTAEESAKDFRIDHHEFIADVDKDPRRAIAESMLQNIPKIGSIVAYNQSFEKNCINSLASHCPDISEELLALNDRFVDLIEPFRGGGYYHTDFKGSFSIKKVLPAICPNDERLDYKKLDINNGASASTAYKSMRNMRNDARLNIEKKLFKYCWLDTYAMYAIYSKLLKLLD